MHSPSMEQYQTISVLSSNVTQQIDNRPYKRIIGQAVSPNRSTVQWSTSSKRESAWKVKIQCICPICLETIIDCNEQIEGHKAFYCED